MITVSSFIGVRKFSSEKLKNSISKAILQTKKVDVEEVAKAVDLVKSRLSKSTTPSEIIRETAKALNELGLKEESGRYQQHYYNRKKQYINGWDMKYSTQLVTYESFIKDGESFHDWVLRITHDNKDIMKRIYKKQFIFNTQVLRNRGTFPYKYLDHFPIAENISDIYPYYVKTKHVKNFIELDYKFMFSAIDKEKYQVEFIDEDTGTKVEKEIDSHLFMQWLVENQAPIYVKDSMDNWNMCCPPHITPLKGYINLAEFVVAPFTERAMFDFDDFLDCVNDSVRALDELYDEIKMPDESIPYRPLGLGVFGLSQMLEMMNLDYGSTEALMLCEIIAHMMLNKAVQTSAYLAKEHGTYAKYNADDVLCTRFADTVLSQETIDLIEDYGLRNAKLINIENNAYLSLLFNTSAGIAPHADSDNNTPMARIDTLGVWQRYTDGIVDLPIRFKGQSLEEKTELYLYAMQMGAKVVKEWYI